MDGASSIYGGSRPIAIAKAEGDRHSDSCAAFIRSAPRHPNAHSPPAAPLSYATARPDSNECLDAVDLSIRKATPRRGYLCFTCPRIRV